MDSAQTRAVATVRAASRSRDGFTVIELLTVIAIVGLLLSLIAPAVMVVRQCARHLECANRLKQLGLAQHSFLEVHGHFPTTSEPFPSSIAGLQRLVPYLNGHSKSFVCPADRREAEGDPDGLPRNYYQNDGCRFRRFDRNGFASDRDAGLPSNVFHDTTAADITDGLSNTVAISEQLLAAPDDGLLTETQLRADPHRYFWYTSLVYPDEETLASACDGDRQSPYPLTVFTSGFRRCGYDHILPPNHIGCINGPYTGPLGGYERNAALPASSQHGGYVNVLLVDGAVRSVADHIDLKVWRALGTRAGAETTGLE